jgi:DNA-binding response OmpR family regulator
MAKILIAEDEPDIRDLITFTLRFAGHDVIVTANGEDALRNVQSELPDLVLLDVRMPRMNGYEVCQHIRQDEKIKNIPVVFLSAKGQENEIEAGMQVGATEYIVKPFSPDELTEKIRSILAH